MSTTWYYTNFSLTRFWGGKKRGQMIQITQKDSWTGLYNNVQLTEREFKIINNIIKDEMAWEKESLLTRFLNILRLKH